MDPTIHGKAQKRRVPKYFNRRHDRQWLRTAAMWRKPARNQCLPSTFLDRKREKKVSWASGANLCQLKYFKKADCPAKVGQLNPDHPQLKASHSYRVVSDGGSSNVNLQIPQVQWKTPPEFILRSNWHVAAGEESEEIEVQKHRETGILEAFYPRLSSIPPSPFISLNTEGQLYDDTYTPILPITPREEISEMDLSSSATSNISIDSPLGNLLQGSSTSTTLNTPPCNSVSTLDPSNNGKSALAIPDCLEGDIVVATVSAANAILKSKEPGSLIDTDLLVQLLKNPEMTQELINKHMLSSITSTRTSESEVFGHAVPMPNSQLPLDKSDYEHSTPSTAKTEAIHRPLIIKLSSSVNANSGTASGLKPIQPLVSLLRSTNDLLVKSVNHENNQPVNGRNVAAMRILEPMLAANAGTGTSSRPKPVIPSVSHTSSTCDLLSEKSTWSQSVSTRSQTGSKPANQYPSTNPETGMCSQPKPLALSVSLSCSPPDILCKKLANEHGHQANIGAVAMLKPATDEVRTGPAPKTVTPSVSLLMSVCDLPGKKSTNEHIQQAVSGNRVVPKPVATQPVAADTDYETGFGEKTGTPPVSLAISVDDLPGKKATSEHNQQVNTGNEVALKPVVTQSAVVDIRTGSGFRTKAGTQSVPLSTLTHDLLGKRSTSEQNQQVNTGNMVVATPAVNTRTGTGFRIKPGVAPMSVHDLPGKKCLNEANTVDELVAKYQPYLVPRINALNNAVAVPVAESQTPSTLRINAEFLDAPTNFGSSPVAKPVHSTGPILDISRLKKLIDEHGAHVEGGHAPVVGINPIFPNPSKPDLEMLKKMVSQYGLHDNSEIPLPGSDHLLVPSPDAMFDAFSPLREHKQPPQLLPASSSTCSIMEFEPKLQKPCLYYNTPKGCRKGSTCRFLHDPSKQGRYSGVLEAPKTKKMKPGRELTGRT